AQALSGHSHARIAFEHPDAATLRVKLAGSWSMEAKRPPIEDAIRAIESNSLSRITFDSAAVEHWDSALLIFLDALFDRLAKRNVEFDRSGLPPGVRRLLAMAETKADSAEAAPPASQSPFVARVGAGTVAS